MSDRHRINIDVALNCKFSLFDALKLRIAGVRGLEKPPFYSRSYVLRKIADMKRRYPEALFRKPKPGSCPDSFSAEGIRHCCDVLYRIFEGERNG